MSIKNIFTDKPMKYMEFMSRDKKSYKMLPTDSAVWFKETGINKLKKNDEIKGPGRVIKQSIEWNDIAYIVEYPLNSANYLTTKASLLQLFQP
tara:strand:- start:1663 stop:1941 length:279 start_codon:yes stop_codon:yes gene_type:complete